MAATQQQRRTSAAPALSTVAPFDALRQRLGLTLTQFAAILGVPYSTVYGACHGLALVPRKAQAALRELGVCPAALAQEQRQWLADRGAAWRAEWAQLEAEDVEVKEFLAQLEVSE